MYGLHFTTTVFVCLLAKLFAFLQMLFSLSICLSACKVVCLVDLLSVRLLICQFVALSTYLFACLFIYLFQPPPSMFHFSPHFHHIEIQAYVRSLFVLIATLLRI